MAKVTGLGGIFYKAADPAATKAWYRDKLGIGGEWGIMFNHADERADAFGLISVFKPDSDKFAPSAQPFMINLRVDDLDGLVDELESKGVPIMSRQDDDHGKFAWIMDPDGIKLELYQQVG